MLIPPKTIQKLSRIVTIYSERIFAPEFSIDWEYTITNKHLRKCPGDEHPWQPLLENTKWGKRWHSMWIRGTFQVPDDWDKGGLYLMGDTGGIESLLILDGRLRGIFNTVSNEEGIRGNHKYRLLFSNPQPGTKHEIALECYAGHPCVGTMPFDPREEKQKRPDHFSCTFNEIKFCRKRNVEANFVTELRILLQLAENEKTSNFLSSGIYQELLQVFKIIPQQPGDYYEEDLLPLIDRARSVMAPLLHKRNGSSAPRVGIMGHSHMDTAWLWTVEETKRKCARTFSNTINLMDEYPEYRFLQSSPYHLEMMRDEYPTLFDEIKEKIRKGRWEPNGGSWVEPDCNIPSGESLTRQFLYGQNYLMENFNYRADTFWQPDVFGYSAALPQILKLCGIENFLTTKLSWNETNRFPYDTFLWKGIDGSSVLTHFNTTHCWPDPKSLIDQVEDIQHKEIQQERFCAFGYGDGGGGPQFEMIETAAYLKDLEGVPRTDYQNVSEFMNDLREKTVSWPIWKGELYLELHRGTLTSFHKMKLWNRKVEFLLREAEFLYSVLESDTVPYPKKEIEECWKTLLQNQFHDILPGTSIPEVNEIAVKEITACAETLSALIQKLECHNPSQHDEMTIQVWNSQSWDRTGCFKLIGFPRGFIPRDEDLEFQKVKQIDGREGLLLSGMTVPALGSVEMKLKSGESAIDQSSFFRFDGTTLTTDIYEIQFSNNGSITSFFDKKESREIVPPDGSINSILCGEDIPTNWDSWDVDYDQRWKMNRIPADSVWVVDQEGPLELRLRNSYTLGKESSITQQMVFQKNSMQISFETMVNWNENHKLLKAGFDLDIQTDRCRHEIQYGHIERNNHENLPQDRSQFEVSNHRWSDLSEPGYGVALLNDCKYGVSKSDKGIELSLLKSGAHPDPLLDRGIHFFTYSLLPHTGGFNTSRVIRPARELNAPLTVLGSRAENSQQASLLRIDEENILVESIKKAEDGNGIIVRMIETEKKPTKCKLEMNRFIQAAFLCNLLEESMAPMGVEGNAVICLSFYGFEIKTLRIITSTQETSWEDSEHK